MASQLFSPYRALGLVCDGRSGGMQAEATSVQVFASAGHRVHVYDAGTQRLLFAGEPQARKVRGVVPLGRMRWVQAGGEELAVLKRGKILARRPLGARVTALHGLGALVLAVTDSRELHVLDFRSARNPSLLTRFFVAPDDFTPSVLMHPATYLNKVVLGGQDGRLALVNFRTGRLVHAFECRDASGSAVSSLAQSPAVDVVAVGHRSGLVVVLNLREDRELMRFHVDGEVGSLAFRSEGPPMLAVGVSDGRLVLLDLERERQASQVNHAHRGRIGVLLFLPREPVLLSLGADNAAKSWIFDQADVWEARLLRSRSGHHGPATRLIFYNDRYLLSAGSDRALRRTSLHSDAQNVEFSQKTVFASSNTRVPPFVDIDACAMREYDWDNVVSAHVGSAHAQVWATRRTALCQPTLTAAHSHSAVTAVRVSSCGHYALLGTHSGGLHLFTLQSATQRAAVLDAHPKHPISGVFTNDASTEAVTVGLDGCLRFWAMPQLTKRDELKGPAPIHRAAMHRGSGLLALADDAGAIRVVDVAARRVVRQWGRALKAQAVDLCFSPDARWLVVAGADSMVQVWDVVAARLLDRWRTDRPVTALAFSPTGDYLATAHAGRNEVFLWTNRAFFGDLPLKPVPAAPRLQSLPVHVSVDPLDENQAKPTEEEEEREENEEDSENEKNWIKQEADEDEEEKMEGEEQEKAEKAAGERGEPSKHHAIDLQHQQGLITLSGLPQQTWARLPMLDELRERNRPTEAPKKPEAAPFYLQTTSSLTPQFVADAASAAESSPAKPGSRFLQLGALNLRSRLAELISEGRHEDALQHLLDLTTSSAIDLEVRSLDVERDLPAMLAFFLDRLETGRCFELLHAVLAVFLRVYGSALADRPELAPLCSDLLRLTRAKWSVLHELIQSTSCMIQFCSLPPHAVGSLSGWN